MRNLKITKNTNLKNYNIKYTSNESAPSAMLFIANIWLKNKEFILIFLKSMNLS